MRARGANIQRAATKITNMPYWGQWLLCCGWRKLIKQGEGIWGQKLLSSAYSRMTGNRGDDLTWLYYIGARNNLQFPFSTFITLI